MVFIPVLKRGRVGTSVEFVLDKKYLDDFKLESNQLYEM
jgi:hypothetical protein